MAKKYRVTLTRLERNELEQLLSAGKADVRRLSLNLWMNFRTKQSGKRLKKRAQASSEKDVVHSSQAICGIRFPHGGCLEHLQNAA